MVKLQKRKRGKKDGVTVCPAIGSEEVPWVRNDEELMLATSRRHPPTCGERRTIAVLPLQLHCVDEVDEVLLAVDVQLEIDVADVGLRRALGDVELLLDVR